jgi:SAM-dependent methyltransferase
MAKYAGPELATEHRSLEQVVATLTLKRKQATVVLSRLKRFGVLPDQARILDIGSAAGTFVATCNQLGYHCEGIDPSEEARLVSEELSRYLGATIRVKPGRAESIPYEPNTFDVVHARSVIEHVEDVEKAFSEIFRVLKPGGVFWFSAASAACPKQAEIKGFPFFGWYPDPLKQRIMSWAKDHRPQLVNYTKTPAINWFTPRKARRLLRKHGFDKVYDRWDLRGLEEGGKMYRTAVRVISSSAATKRVADTLVPDCSYAAFKPQSS